ncbi:G-protein signaling regulator protein [Orobanche gracilis]
MATCDIKGGCPSDYMAISISILSFILLLAMAFAPYLIHKIPRPKGRGFWLIVIQVFASFNLLLSTVMALNLLRIRRQHWWNSCYIWSVWVEGPLGFGLLLSSRILQTFQLYNIFVKRRLPPIRSFLFLPLVLLPWIASAAFISIAKPLNNRCHMGTRYIIPVSCLHVAYIAALIGLTRALQHIEFRFQELKDLWRGILVSTCCIGSWVVAYFLHEIYQDVSLLQIISRSLLLVMVNVLVLAFFSVSISEPLVSLMSLKKKDQRPSGMMGWALGLPDGRLLVKRGLTQLVDPNEPLDKLLLNRRFISSFMEFADRCSFLECFFVMSGENIRRNQTSRVLLYLRNYFWLYLCLAGESVHFYEEVQQFDKIPTFDHVRRIYMARHIIDNYLTPGSAMEVNISHRCRQEILSTLDLAHPDLFKNAVNELMQLMKMNLANAYWSSTFYMKLKEEARMKILGHELENVGWKFLP